MKILIIGESEKLRSALRDELQRGQCIVNTHSDTRLGFRHFTMNYQFYDLVIIDYLLTESDAQEISDMSHRNGASVPILSLTGNRTIHERDGYMVTSLSLERIITLVRALTHRPPIRLQVNNIELDPESRIVTQNGEPVDLTPKEFAILEYLMKAPNHVVRREKLIDYVWDDDITIFSNVVDVHINNLRKKLKKGNSRNTIKTVRGIGYTLRLR